MPIEIRELHIKVKIEEPLDTVSGQNDIHNLKHLLLRECKKEVRKQLNNLTQRYNPNLYSTPLNLKSTEIFPYQLSFKNTGTTNFYSNGLTFNINLSTFKGREYVVPNV